MSLVISLQSSFHPRREFVALPCHSSAANNAILHLCQTKLVSRPPRRWCPASLAPCQLAILDLAAGSSSHGTARWQFARPPWRRSALPPRDRHSLTCLQLCSFYPGTLLNLVRIRNASCISRLNFDAIDPVSPPKSYILTYIRFACETLFHYCIIYSSSYASLTVFPCSPTDDPLLSIYLLSGSWISFPTALLISSSLAPTWTEGQSAMVL